MTAVAAEIDTELSEMLDQSTPCDLGDLCKSNLELPASWLWTHKGGQPVCSLRLCSRCDRAYDMYLSMRRIINGGTYHCKRCDMDMPRKYIMRRAI